MVNIVRVNADRGRDFHPLADHMTKLRNFTKEYSEFPFSLKLMFDPTLSNLIMCLMILQKNTYKSCTNELASCRGN